jgi:hypothetical protein
MPTIIVNCISNRMNLTPHTTCNSRHNIKTRAKNQYGHNSINGVHDWPADVS